MNPERLRLEAELEQIERDLEEVAIQHADGEIDADTFGRLDAAYRAERERVVAALAAVDDAPVAVEEAAPRRSRGRMIAGAAVLVVAVVAVSVFAVNSLRNRTPASLNGVAGEVAAGQGRDLSTVSNEEMEAVVAANPDVVGMRMALARRYFEAGEFDKALKHYMVVLEKEPNPEALANVGWMSYLSGRADVAEKLEERALQLDPTYTPAYWFLANVRMYGLDDAPGAVEPLQRLLSVDGIPDDVRTEAEKMLTEAQG